MATIFVAVTSRVGRADECGMCWRAQLRDEYDWPKGVGAYARVCGGAGTVARGDAGRGGDGDVFVVVDVVVVVCRYCRVKRR